MSGINGHFGSPGWVPIHYLHRSLDRAELLAYYRAADIALITPLRDGMNLVCKEYCAAQMELQNSTPAPTWATIIPTKTPSWL